MYAAYKVNLKKGNEKDMNHLGIDVLGKRKYRAVAIKDDNGRILDEFFFGNDRKGIHNLLSRM
jgi:hypothetical protein